MRTEKEIRERIEVIDQRFIKILRSRRKGDIPNRAFEELFSNAWEEEVALYWSLGMGRKAAAYFVGAKFMGMSDELKRSK